MTESVTIEGVSKMPARQAKQDVVTAEPPTEGAALINMIERVARTPGVDIAQLKQLMDMQERILDRNAKAAYARALAALQAELPVINRRGRIEVRKKDSAGERTGALQQSTPYALWEDINEAIKPHLAAHGFALSFRTGLAADGKITVTGILSHRDGHQEETTMPLVHDSTGSKNAVQAVGSSISYGKRYTAAALLNLTSRGEDDDGKAGGAKSITAEEAQNIRDALVAINNNTVEPRLLKWLRVNSVEDIPSDRYDDAMARLQGVQKQ